MLKNIQQYFCKHIYQLQELKCLNMFDKRPFIGKVAICMKCGKWDNEQTLHQQMQAAANDYHHDIH